MTQSTILVIDDDDLLCEMLASLLELEGFAVTLAHNGEEGLAQLRQRRFDLVLLDLVMPYMDGLRFLRLMPENISAPPPVLIMSASITDEVSGNIRNPAVVGAIRKPIQPGQLVSQINAAMDGANIAG